MTKKRLEPTKTPLKKNTQNVIDSFKQNFGAIDLKKESVLHSSFFSVMLCNAFSREFGLSFMAFGLFVAVLHSSRVLGVPIGIAACCRLVYGCMDSHGAVTKLFGAMVDKRVLVRYSHNSYGVSDEAYLRYLTLLDQLSKDVK